MGTFNFCNTNMVSLAYTPESLTDEDVYKTIADHYPHLLNDYADRTPDEQLQHWRETLREFEQEEVEDMVREAEVFGRALRDELESRFPFHRALRDYCSDWSWEFEVRNGYYAGFQLVLSSQMVDALFEPESNGPSGSDRKQWDYLYELTVDSKEFSGVTRQDFEAILEKVWRFSNYALIRYGNERGYSGAVGSWTCSTYTLPAYDAWAESEKEKVTFDEWYQCVMRSYECYGQ